MAAGARSHGVAAVPFAKSHQCLLNRGLCGRRRWLGVLPLPGIALGSSSPWSSHYTDCAILVVKIEGRQKNKNEKGKQRSRKKKWISERRREGGKRKKEKGNKFIKKKVKWKERKEEMPDTEVTFLYFTSV
jgi:hypothetical protein